MTKETMGTVRLAILVAVAAACLTACPPPSVPKPKVDNFVSWSTNFAAVTDPAASGIATWINGTKLSIDTTNVKSGGKSIRNSGPVDDSRILQTVFVIGGLTGSDTVDLSNKTLSVEIFVPSGPPLGNISIDLMSKNTSLTVRANVYAENLRGRWYTCVADTKILVALGGFRYYDWMHSASISSSSDAVALLKQVDAIRISAGNWADLHETGDTYFLIDKLGWEPSKGLTPLNSTSLQKSAPSNLVIGNFVESARSSDPQWLRFTVSECGSLEENQESTRWPATEPLGDDFSGTVPCPADRFFDSVSGALDSKMFRYMVYDSIPDWLTAKSYAETQVILDNFVRAKVGCYKGKTKIWFMFNEILRYDIGWVPLVGLGLKDRNQVPQTWGNEYSPFSSSTSDLTMIEDAFRTARAADPDALLFLVDSANEEYGRPKSDACYNLVAQLVSDGTPIDGVGMQAHLMVGADGAIRTCGGSDYTLAFNPIDGLTGIAVNVERYRALGLQVVFAEVDVPIYTADIDSTASGQAIRAQRMQTQADVYRSLMHITLTEPNMPAFVLFATADLYSWYFDTSGGVGYGEPGIFDLDFRPKPAYYALLDELRSH